MPSLEELKEEESLLESLINANSSITSGAEERLSVVRKLINALEDSYDHGGWEDS